ncbi:MAG: bifunctional nuclease family protein [Prevotella sp.]|nr:bifunctional nuclease family protein [Prevotella sp.]
MVNMKMERISLRYRSLSEIVGSADGMSIITLTDESEERALNIICDKTMAAQLQLRSEQVAICKSLLPEVLTAMLQEYVDLKDLEITVYDIRDGQYLVSLMNSDNYFIRQIRMSDAILLHVISNIPISIDKKLMQAQSVPFRPNVERVSIPINVLETDKLREELGKAVEEEDYRLASYINEELKRREEGAES